MIAEVKLKYFSITSLLHIHRNALVQYLLRIPREESLAFGPSANACSKLERFAFDCKQFN